MFSSRTLAERNNDPVPYKYDETRRYAVAQLGSYAPLAPRTEFQHGTLPENPILVEFREDGTDGLGIDWWLDAIEFHPHPMWSMNERRHAHRVLSLLPLLTPAPA